MARSTQANVEVRIFGNISDFSKKMNMAEFQAMSFQKKMLAMSGVMKSWGQNMTMGITLPVVIGMGLAVKAASSLEETMNKVKVVFGSASGEVIKFADTAAKKLAMSKQEALDAAAGFGNLFNTTGMAEGKSADMSKTLVKLAADMASFNDSTPVLMLEKLRSGLVGEAEPLRTVGVLLSEARVQEEAYASGIATRGAALTEAQKVQARYNIILQDTKKQQGDIDKTAGSLANQLKFLRAQAMDLGASVGSVLIPALKPLAAALIKVAEVIAGLPGWMKSAIVYVGLFAAAMGPLLWAFGSAVQGIRAIKEAWDVARRLFRTGTWQAETVAIDLNTAAIGRNTKARGTNSLVPAAPQLMGGGKAAAGGMGVAGMVTAIAIPVAAGIVAAEMVLRNKPENTAAGNAAAQGMINPRSGTIMTPERMKMLVDSTGWAKFSAIKDALKDLDPAAAGSSVALQKNIAALKSLKATTDDGRLSKAIDGLAQSAQKSKPAFEAAAQAAKAALDQVKESVLSSAKTVFEGVSQLAKSGLRATAEELRALTLATIEESQKIATQIDAMMNPQAYKWNKKKGEWQQTKPIWAEHDRTGDTGMWRRPQRLSEGKGTVHVHIGTLVGTDERAARKLSDMVGRHLMRGVMRGMVGQNA